MIKIDIENLDDLRDKAKELGEFGAPYVEISRAFVETIDLLDQMASDNRTQALTLQTMVGVIDAQKDELNRLRKQIWDLRHND